eukprot:2914474-Rhodomonas_salina.1
MECSAWYKPPYHHARLGRHYRARHSRPLAPYTMPVPGMAQGARRVGGWRERAGREGRESGMLLDRAAVR